MNAMPLKNKAMMKFMPFPLGDLKKIAIDRNYQFFGLMYWNLGRSCIDFS
jgi:hypothetical protein